MISSEIRFINRDQILLEVEKIATKIDPAENVNLVRHPIKTQYISLIPFEAISTGKPVQNPEGSKIKGGE